MTFNLDTCVGYVTDNAMKQIADAFNRRLQNLGVTRIQWIALYYTKTRPMISQRDLSVLMNVTDSSSGRLIDRLERDGLLERVRSESDRRLIHLKLTELGEQQIDSLMDVGQQFSEDLLEGISAKEREDFERLLKKMIVNVKM